MAAFVAYYRVSTDKQGLRGLGLDAQRRIVAEHISPEKPIAEFTEIESGKTHVNRPQLAMALEECRKKKATLVIAKLDRLGRNVAFIATLMEGAVDFICCDNPHATRFLLHVLAAFAEHERLMISERTKVALVEARKRGTKLGNPRIEIARALALEAIRKKAPAKEVASLMKNWRDQQWAYRRIADELNRLNIKPPRGKCWYASNVRNVIKSSE